MKCLAHAYQSSLRLQDGTIQCILMTGACILQLQAIYTIFTSLLFHCAWHIRGRCWQLRMRGSLSIAAMAAIAATASGGVIPLAEVHEIRASAAATIAIPGTEKEAAPARVTSPLPSWFQALLPGTATISSSSSATSTPAGTSTPVVTSTSSTPVIPTPVTTSGSTVTSELTVTPVPTL